MSLKSLAVEVLGVANEDLMSSDNLYDLDKNFHFFNSNSFSFWSEVGGIGDETQSVIKKNVKIKYEVLKHILNILSNMKGRYYLKDGNIIICTCINRALYQFEDIIGYLEAVRIKRGVVGLRLNFDRFDR